MEAGGTPQTSSSSTSCTIQYGQVHALPRNSLLHLRATSGAAGRCLLALEAADLLSERLGVVLSRVFVLQPLLR